MAKETRIKITTDRFRNKISEVANRDSFLKQNLTPGDDPASVVVERLSRIDPTKNSKYLVWLTQQYCDKRFLIEDEARVHNALQRYIELKPRLARYGYDTDLNRYDLHALEDTIEKIYLGQMTKQEFSLSPEEIGLPSASYEILYDGPLGTLTVPKTMEAAQFFGRGTRWCTSSRNPDDNMFDHYCDDINDPLQHLYIWKSKDGGKYQFHWDSCQFMDEKDRSISTAQLAKLREHPVLGKIFHAQESLMLSRKKTENIIEYACDVLGGRWPDAEKTIIESSTRDMYKYAKLCVRGRWPEAEPALLRGHPLTLAMYTQDCYRRRWDEAEQALLKSKDIHSIVQYANLTIKSRWPEAESIILASQNFGWIASYAESVIKGRWSEAENMLLASGDSIALEDYPNSIYMYAQDCVKGRWKEAEQALLRSKEILSIITYASTVIKGRWPEAESLILASQNFAWIASYAQSSIKDRWSEAENMLLASGDPIALTHYASRVIKERWLEAEPAILSGDATTISQYAHECTHERWPEAEKIIIDSKLPVAIMNYADKHFGRFVSTERWHEAEEVLLALNNPSALVEYATAIIKDRWREAEYQIYSDQEALDAYCERFDCFDFEVFHISDEEHEMFDQGEVETSPRISACKAALEEHGPNPISALTARNFSIDI